MRKMIIGDRQGWEDGQQEDVWAVNAAVAAKPYLKIR